jgi:hypothetical protein
MELTELRLASSKDLFPLIFLIENRDHLIRNMNFLAMRQLHSGHRITADLINHIPQRRQ